MFDCWKYAKKQFRAASRRCVRSVFNKPIENLNNLFRDGKNARFWNVLNKQAKRKTTVSSLSSANFRNYYNDIMKDIGDLDSQQQSISNEVKSKYYENRNLFSAYDVDLKSCHFRLGVE